MNTDKPKKDVKPEDAKPEKIKSGDSALGRFAKKYPVVYMTLTLFLLTAVVAFALGFVHGRTDPVIKERQAQQLVESVAKVVPGAADSEPLEGYEFASAVKSARVVYDSARNPLGFAIEVAPSGFGGAIRMLAGVSPEGVVTGVAILEMKETPNLGTKTRSEEFLAQFIGKDHDFKMDGQDVQAISGATVSSKAVSSGVSAAIAAVLLITQGGGA